MKYKNLILVTLLGILLLFRPPADPDFGWHFKYGEYAIQNRQILKENIFSYTMPNYEWANSYWLSQIVLYTLYTGMGAVGMALVLSALFSLVSYKILGDKILAIFLLFLFLGEYLIVVRPLFYSSIFLLILAHQLLYKKKLAWWLPIMFLFWANMHADFALGLVILGAYILNNLFRRHRERSVAISLAGTGILCVLVTLINPYGIGLWETLLRESHPLQFLHIAEWTPFKFANDVEGLVMQNAIYIVGGLLVSAAIMKKEKYGFWYTALSILFFLISLRARYFFRILLILNIFVFDEFWIQNLKKISIPKYVEEKINKLKGVYFVLLMLVSVGFFSINVWQAADIKRWSARYGYPYEKVQELKQNPTEGNIFNSYDWGGYLIWHLPGYKTFVDGRMPSWRHENGYSVFEDYLEIVKKDNKELLEGYKEKYNIQIILSDDI
ncbi:hypothetical protein ACFL13_02845 [Patescibacteria group bacterium]